VFLAGGMDGSIPYTSEGIMRLSLAFMAFALALPAVAIACPGKEATAVASVEADAAACAKRAELVQGACSYSTGVMAQRVLDGGTEFSFTGRLVDNDDALQSRVAAPFVVGDAIHVIANGVVERLPDLDARLTMHGKLLEVNGVRYFLLTEFNRATS
jgi:hypothetical protein